MFSCARNGNLPFWKRLKLARVGAGVLQRRVAFETGIDPSLLSQFENGWKRPTREQLARICAVIGIRPEDLEDTAA